MHHLIVQRFQKPPNLGISLRCYPQHHLTKIVQKFPIKCQHQIQIRCQSTRFPMKWRMRNQPNEPKEPDEPIQEVSWYDIPCVPQGPDQNGKTETEVPIQEVSWYAIPGVPENEIPPNSPNSDNVQINLKCITLKNEEQEPQADSVKSNPTNIMMGTMPTQRRFNLTKAKGKGQRQKRRRKMYYFGKHINKVSQRCYPQSSSKLRKLIPFRPLTKYYQLVAIHLIQDKLERPISPICLMTRDKKSLNSNWNYFSQKKGLN